MCAPQQNGRVCKAWSKPSPTRSSGRIPPLTTRRCSTLNRDSQLDDSSNDIRTVSCRCVASRELSGGPRGAAGIAAASASPTISAAGLPRSGAAADLPRSGVPGSGATGLPRSRIRRANRCATAATAGGNSATARSRDGVDTGLLELGRPLGVGAGPLCRPTLCSCCLGSRSVAPTTRHLGLDPGTLASVVFGDD